MFYSQNIEGEHIIFSDQEATHISKALRYKTGQSIQSTDGKGHLYDATIDTVKKNKVKAIITKRNFVPKSWAQNIHLVIAPTKNISRMEWMVEKLCEIGIDQISFIETQNRERKSIKIERIRSIAISAMKQSLKTHLPQVGAMMDFDKFIVGQKEIKTEKYIAHCRSNEPPFLYTHYPAGKNVLICIGPEGDFSLQEIRFAKQNGFIEVSLGEARLRTETAGLTACLGIRIVNTMTAI